MARPTFVPVFEELESTIKGRMLARISDDWRKEPGDFIYDAVAPSALEVQLTQIQRDYLLKNSFAQYAEDAYLDLLMAEVGLTRFPATPNKRDLLVTADAGVVIPLGHTAVSVILDGEGNPYEFTVDEAITYAVSGTQTVALTAKLTGVETNVPDGSEFILQPSIPGVRVIVDDGTTTPGTNKENDDAAYARYEFKIQNPDTGGNKNDYVRWAGEVVGVGKAKCIPRWDGNGSVKVVIIGSDYQPATPEVVEAVQTYLDPGYPDPLLMGLGDGKAPGGAAVTVVAATDLPINVAANVTLIPGADMGVVTAAFEAKLDEYLKAQAFVEIVDDVDHDNVPVVIAKVGALLIGVDGVSNYSDLTLNAGAIDIPVTTEQVATRGAVTFS